MKIVLKSTRSRQHWLNKSIAGASYRPWLNCPGSLTQRLQLVFPSFSVNILRASFAKPNADESSCMYLTNRECILLRDVHLLSNGQPMVYAHSVLPRQSLRGAWLGLRHLGNKPLGASLFANPKVRRTAFEFKKLTLNHTLYQSAVAHLQVKPPSLWSRRSIFTLNRAKIMVTEVFLPQLLESKSK